MNKFFTQIQVDPLRRNTFDLTHDHKLTGNFGELIPVMCEEVVPGDKVLVGTDVFAQMPALVAPVLHRTDLYCHTWFVPYRVLWENYNKYITQQTTGGKPYIQVNSGWTDEQKRLADYLCGIPPMSVGQTPYNVSALPFAAYQAVWNEFYRAQFIQTAVDYKLTDGDQNARLADLCALRKRNWGHDYFTSALPDPQIGAAIDVPLGDVTLKSQWENNSTPFWVDENQTVPNGDVTQNGGEINLGISADKAAYDPDGSLEVEPTTIIDLRRAFALQKFFEALQRGGLRTIEVIKNIFKVSPPDFRLQIPEYVTGTKSPFTVSTVLNTTGSFDPTNPTDPSSAPQGSPAGRAVAVADGMNGYYDVKEHGVMITILSVMPQTGYMQGVRRQWTTFDEFEEFNPYLEHIGEQAIKESEIYAGTATPDAEFGYIPRNSHYKYAPNRVSGLMRDDLAFWHMVPIYASAPTLSESFLQMNAEDIERVFAVADEPQLIMQVLNRLKMRRPMAYYSNPGL